MSPRTLSRLSGTALIFGSILLATGYAISSLLIPQGFIGMYSAPIAVSAYVLRIVGATFLLMGLPAVFARQAQGSRSVASSLIGFIMTFLGIATLEVGMNAIYAFIFPPLATNPATQSLLISFDANRPMGASAPRFADRVAPSARDGSSSAPSSPPRASSTHWGCR